MNKYLATTTLAAALAMTACGDNETVETTAVPPTVDPAAATAIDSAMTTGTAPGGMNAMGDVNPTPQERELLGVLMVVNEHQVNAANQAMAKNVTGEVADYARRMIEEHTGNREMTARMNPDTNAAMAVERRQQGEAHLSKLDGMQGDEYSRAFVEGMIKDHQQALEMLDNQAIPAATTPEVQEHLRQTREAIAAHLEQAQELQKQMAGS